VNFASFAFLSLLALVLAARLTIGRRKIEPAFVRVLLLSSLVFYTWHIPIYLLVLLASTIIDYGAGRALGRIDAQLGRAPVTTTRSDGAPSTNLGVTPAAVQRQRRAWLVASLGANLGLLAWFKYAGFFGTNVAAALAALGFSWSPGDWSFVLPMGISFYTFQSMSYTIDVYRRDIPPAKSFASFLLYVSFFPQLVAGPIVRAAEFLPQMDRPRRLRWASLTEGVFLIASGYFLKVVCADNLATFVDAQWPAAVEPGANSLHALWVAVMFSGQIFADFAGYSNIARGLSYLLGYRLPVNFNLPYLAGSFQNFWQRWHITLSSWLRDYLYVSLGGNRRGAARTYVNLMVVMLLGGLWHGASWTYVVWGTLHGICLAGERFLGFHRDEARARVPLLSAAWFVVVQAAVLISWVFFRSESLGDAWQLLDNVARLELGTPTASMWAASAFLYPLVAWHAWGWAVEREWTPPLAMLPRAALAAAMVLGVLVAYGRTSAFIYFQF
jgi:alginate O-acetyltransferase complex protein AlgI